MKHYRRNTAVASSDDTDIVGRIVRMNQLTELIEGLEQAVDYLDERNLNTEAMFAISDAVAFLTDLMRA
jgi:hypothetical protein